MPASDRDVRAVDVPRFILLSADFAELVVEYLDGLNQLLARGRLSRAQLRVLSHGRAAGGIATDRVGELVAEMAAAIRQQLD